MLSLWARHAFAERARAETAGRILAGLCKPPGGRLRLLVYSVTMRDAGRRPPTAVLRRSAAAGAARQEKIPCDQDLGFSFSQQC